MTIFDVTILADSGADPFDESRTQTPPSLSDAFDSAVTARSRTSSEIDITDDVTIQGRRACSPSAGTMRRGSSSTTPPRNQSTAISGLTYRSSGVVDGDLVASRGAHQYEGKMLTIGSTVQGSQSRQRRHRVRRAALLISGDRSVEPRARRPGRWW
jgi:hypothetical protein